MQIVFLTKHEPQDYIKNGCGEYPDAPIKCPNKDCGFMKELCKHGYYWRYLNTEIFLGLIRIRRYLCKKCKHTVSMLPYFCLAKYTNGVELVVDIMSKAAETGSISRVVKIYEGIIGITRKLVKHYLTRLHQNRYHIQYAVNQMSPAPAIMNWPPGDAEWTRYILLGTGPTLTAEFNAEYHKAMGMSFMSTQNRIA